MIAGASPIDEPLMRWLTDQLDAQDKDKASSGGGSIGVGGGNGSSSVLDISDDSLERALLEMRVMSP